MRVEPGTRVGPYEIVSPLGAGGMGEVFRARDERLNREVAVKVLPEAVAGDPDRLRRFEQEARSAGGLNDPNVLVVYDFGTHQGRPYLVTELLEGSTLRDRLRDGPLPFRKALEVGAQVARGLAAAHARGIVHRDIKPENLFITREGRVKILDFGVARTTEAQAQQGTLPLTGSGAVMGTAGYMSPEQVRGQPADARSDIFSFGAVLYELLCGVRAFEGETAVDRGYAILNKDPEPLGARVQGIPLAAEALVRRCLEKNPEERFQSSRDLAFALEALSQTTSDRTGTISGGVTPAPAALRRRAVLTAAALGVPALFAGGYLTRMVVDRRKGSAASTEASRHFTRLTFQPARISTALFAPEGNTILLSAAFADTKDRIYSTLPGQPGVRPLTDETTQLAAVSSTSELAVLRLSDELPAGTHTRLGFTLSRVPLSGAIARDVMEDVQWADFGPDDQLLAVRQHLSGFTLEYPIGKVRLEDGGWISSPRVSRSGERIAYAYHPVDGDDRGWIEVLELDGTRHRLTPEWYTLRGVSWSPDDREVWFTGSEEVVLRALYTVSMEGRIRPLLKAPSSIQIFDTAADGRALLGRCTTRFRLMVNLPGEEKERDLSLFDASLARALSADGTTLLFDEGAETSRGDYDSYVRKTSGGPVVPLGKGRGHALSPDGKWAVISHAPKYDGLTLVPTGAGVSKKLNVEGIGRIVSCHFFPDAQSLIVMGRAGNSAPALYRVTLNGAAPEKLFSVESLVYVGPPSADGTTVPVHTSDKGSMLARISDGELTPLKLGKGRALRFSEDGRLFFSHADLQLRILDLGLHDPRTGQSTTLRKLKPPEGGLVRGFHGGAVAANGAYAYTYNISEDELYLAEGLS